MCLATAVSERSSTPIAQNIAMKNALNFVMLARPDRTRNLEQHVTADSITLYGIKNCDTVKKARKWLDDHNITYAFHDFRSDGLDSGKVERWAQALGWETLLNRRSATWKQLDPALRNSIDTTSAIAAMTTHPTLIKRPVLELQNHTQVGFAPNQYQQLFG